MTDYTCHIPAAPYEPEGGIKVGIDAANLRLGGGVTHLVELISALNPSENSISHIVVWGGTQTLLRLPEVPWLTKRSPSLLNGGLLSRVLWQLFGLTAAAKKEACDVLFIPGGSYMGSFMPVVSMSQNLLPFEWREVMRNNFSIFTFKMILLRLVQAWTFRHSEGVIFLTQYAKNTVENVTGKLTSKTIIIPHGLSSKFSRSRRVFKNIQDHSEGPLFRLLYVSNVDAYKHQMKVLNAVQMLRQKNYPLSISFIGPGSHFYIHALKNAIKKIDPQGLWAEYLGVVPYEKLQSQYAAADLGIFASSCETFGIILLEKMSTGLPIVCSNQSSMEEILQDGGIYCNPENEDSIAEAIEEYVLSSELRAQKSDRGYELSQAYTWGQCASKTFGFIALTTLEYKRHVKRNEAKG